MNLYLVNNLQNQKENDFEIVERKGRGHPDTLADHLAEELSIAYSKFTKKKYGVVLRHQFDKLSLMGGKCDVRFGGGNFRSPIRLLINGRVTSSFGDEVIEFRDLLINTAKNFLEKELRNFDFQTDCRVLLETTSNSTRGMIGNKDNLTSAIHHRFHPRTLNDLPESSRPIANDTAVGCAWSPYTPLEKLVLEIEQNLTSDTMWKKYPWMGSDCKIMCCRIKNEINLTVSIPQLSTYVHTVEEYKKNYNTVLFIIQEIVNKSEFRNVQITLNPGDDTDKDMLYLRFTGSCIESGDEGQVSRGNRLGGVISSTRPFSIEGLSGKNPSYHAGKIYSVSAWEIAHEISNEFKTSCEVFIASQIDRPINDPWIVVVNSEKALNKDGVSKIVESIITKPEQITQNLLNKKYPLV